jgi:multisubunit Na+/H+ antiporter MnhF subunit
MTELNLILQMISGCCLIMATGFTLLAIWRCSNIFIKLVALEVMVNLFICGVGLWAYHIHFPPLLDICIALSLIMFLTTVAYCQLLYKRKLDNV